MAIEVTQKSFFNHSTYPNTFYASLLPLEYFLSQVVVRGDSTRVFWASSDIAYRRRFELMSKENGGDYDNITPQGLNFPFVSYSPAGGFWSPDDRPAVLQAKQLIRGIYNDGFPEKMRAMPVKCSFTVIAHFDRDDDARLAYEALLWEQVPKGPVQFATTVKWKDTIIPIPVNMTLDSVEFLPAYNEAEWLKKQKIIPIEIKVTNRSYIIHFPDQVNVDSSSRPLTPFSTGFLGTQGPVSITEEVILNFAAVKEFGTLFTFENETNDPTTNEVDPFTSIEQETFVADPVSITREILSGYFEPAENIVNPFVIIDPLTITQTSLSLHWGLEDASLENLQSVKIAIPGQEPITITDFTNRDVLVENLYPGSAYDITVFFYNTEGKIHLFKLSATTLVDITDPAQPIQKRLGRLKGMTW